MRLRQILLAGLLSMATAAGAQGLQFTNYVGSISMPTAPLPLAADAEGRLFVGTFNGPNSTLYVLHDPLPEIGVPSPIMETIHTFPEFVAGRGLQSLQVTSTGDVLVSGDTGSGSMSNLWKFNKSAGPIPVYTEDTAFRAASDLTPARRSAVSIFSDDSNGDGVLISNGLNNIDFFDFDGNHLSGPFRVSENYMREGVYNSLNNVFYAIRNGDGSQEMIRTYVADVDLDGGTLTTNTLISYGASNGNFGGARQNAYYYAAQNQLITMDGDVIEGGDPVPPAVRVWEITNNGHLLLPEYQIDGTSPETPFNSLGDAVVIGNHLYVSSSGNNVIYVFSSPPASVDAWRGYEAADYSELTAD